jgi:hypothetical protein
MAARRLSDRATTKSRLTLLPYLQHHRIEMVPVGRPMHEHRAYKVRRQRYCSGRTDITLTMDCPAHAPAKHPADEGIVRVPWCETGIPLSGEK